MNQAVLYRSEDRRICDELSKPHRNPARFKKSTDKMEFFEAATP